MFSVLCYLNVSHVIVSCQHSVVRRDALWEGCTSGFQAIPVPLSTAGVVLLGYTRTKNASMYWLG